MSQRNRLGGLAGVACGTLLAGMPGIALAGFSDPALVFTATNLTGTGSINITLAQGSALPGGGWQWALAGPPVAITTGGGALIATITAGSITMQDTGGLVATSFAVTAGNSATNIQILSGEVFFPNQFNPQGRASSALTVTDNNGNGASVSGNRPGGTAFSAHYNGAAPLGTPFSNLISGPLTEPNAFGSESTSQAFPIAPGVFAPIAGNVSSISSVWDFTVTANDQASGTSVFVLVPAPASLALLGMGGLLAGRRRR